MFPEYQAELSCLFPSFGPWLNNEDTVLSFIFPPLNDKTIQVWSAGARQGGQVPLALVWDLQLATFHNI